LPEERIMLDSHQIDELIRIASTMSRRALREQLIDFDGSFPVDFTPEFLDRLPIERLRHIFVAACMQSGQIPHDAVAA
jgi:hypothetical protein